MANNKNEYRVVAWHENGKKVYDHTFKNRVHARSRADEYVRDSVIAIVDINDERIKGYSD